MTKKQELWMTDVYTIELQEERMEEMDERYIIKEELEDHFSELEKQVGPLKGPAERKQNK